MLIIETDVSGGRRRVAVSFAAAALSSMAWASCSPSRLLCACLLAPSLSSCSTPPARRTIDTAPVARQNRSPKWPPSSSTAWISWRGVGPPAPGAPSSSDMAAGAGHASTVRPSASKSAPPLAGSWRSSTAPLGRITTPPPRESKAAHVLPSR
eukprot:scaffold6319_cov107-Isochrysis_galbana.AAC.3